MAGPVGPQGPQGYPGPIGPESPGPRGIQGDTGAMGPQGPTGIQGVQGEQGVAGTVGTKIGSYPSLADLQVAVPVGNPSDFYYVEPDLYVWDSVTNQWKDVGPIAGPQGVTGPQGVQGPAGATGQMGVPGAWGAPGATGPAGATGATGTTGTTGAAAPNLVPDYANSTQQASINGANSVNPEFFPAAVAATGGTNGTALTAPGNGYYTVTMQSTNLTPVQWNVMVNGRITNIITQTTAGQWVSQTIPVAAGDSIQLVTSANTTNNGTINYYGAGATNLTFIPTK